MTFKRWMGPDRPVSEGSVITTLDLDATYAAPARARAAVDTLVPHVSADVLERARLLISEVVSNSVQHAGGEQVRVDMWPSSDAVVVRVSDDGPGFVPRSPPGRNVGAGGRGLLLVDELAEVWGSGKGTGAWVWFEVAPRVP